MEFNISPETIIRDKNGEALHIDADIDKLIQQTETRRLHINTIILWHRVVIASVSITKGLFPICVKPSMPNVRQTRKRCYIIRQSMKRL